MLKITFKNYLNERNYTRKLLAPSFELTDSCELEHIPAARRRGGMTLEPLNRSLHIL